MSDFKILVVEDDPLHAETALVYLKKLGYGSVHLTDNSGEAIRLLAAVKPDLVLLDIHILGSMDGVELARKIRLTNALPIIFITSMRDSDTIARASQTNPEAYLIKPLDQAALQAAIEIALVRFSENSTAPVGDEPSPQWDTDLYLNDSFYIKVGNFLKKVALSELRYVKVADEKYCAFYTADRELMVRQSLTELTRKLPAGRFVRVHRSYLINLDFLSGINEKAGTVLVEHTEIPIGKTYRTALYERLNTLR